MATTPLMTRQGQRPAPGTIRQQVDEQERERLRPQGPRSNFLAHFGGQHYATGDIRLRAVEDALIADRRALNPTIIGPFAPYDVLSTPGTFLAAQGNRALMAAIQQACDDLATLLTSSRNTTGNLAEYHEGVVASFSRMGLLFIANATNDHCATLLPDLPAAGFKRLGVSVRV